MKRMQWARRIVAWGGVAAVGGAGCHPSTPLQASLEALGEATVQALTTRDEALFSGLYATPARIETVCGLDEAQRVSLKAAAAEVARRNHAAFEACGRLNWGEAKVARVGGGAERAAPPGVACAALQFYEDMEFAGTIAGEEVSFTLESPIRVEGAYYALGALRCGGAAKAERPEAQATEPAAGPKRGVGADEQAPKGPAPEVEGAQEGAAVPGAEGTTKPSERCEAVAQRWAACLVQAPEAVRPALQAGLERQKQLWLGDEGARCEAALDAATPALRGLCPGLID